MIAPWCRHRLGPDRDAAGGPAVDHDGLPHPRTMRHPTAQMNLLFGVFSTKQEDDMSITESSDRRLMLKSGSTTLLLDKDAGKAILQRKLLFWKLSPAEVPLSDIKEVTVDAGVDRASGVEVCNTMLILGSGAGWAFPAADKKQAEANAAAIRSFVGLAA
jgi:hypothetical protein